MTCMASTSLPRLSRVHIARAGSAASYAARGDVYAREVFARIERPADVKLVGGSDTRNAQGRTMRRGS